MDKKRNKLSGCDFIKDGALVRIRMYDASGEQREIALIDSEDLVKVKNYSWSLGKYYVQGYTRGIKPIQKVRLHNIILPTDDGLDVDHINGDSLDNRKVNLRSATASQNCANAKKIDKNVSSIYKGVSYEKARDQWFVKICKNKKNHYIGRYDNEWEAARAYNTAALVLFGKYARLNVEGIGCP
jgi:hypothetical protein